MSCNVFVYGSCVSRDIFNLDAVGYFNIVDYYARHSIGSIASKPFHTDYNMSEISSDFRRKMVLRDWDKSILCSENTLSKSDIILIDLIDERFNLIALPSGEVLTHSAELVESKLLLSPTVDGYRLITPGSMERRKIWLKGANIFFSWMRTTGNIDKVLINEVYWSTGFGLESSSKFPMSLSTVMKANAELTWMYEQLRRWLSPSQFLSFSKDLFTADEKHRWGISPFHYIPSYYKFAEEKIKEIYETRQDTNSNQLRSHVNGSVALFRDVSRWNKKIKKFCLNQAARFWKKF